jgi:hypothetical protein
MFIPILIIWIIYRKFWKSIIGIFGSIFICAFYILPVIFESKFVNLGSTITGYFDFRAHFVTLYQLFVLRFWGYGGSTWGGEDGLSLAVGLVQWILPALVLLLVLLKKKITANKTFLILLATGMFYIFLTHNKSTFIWVNIPGFAYIQFPWRFLGVATFCLSLSGGAIIQFFEKQKLVISFLIVGILIALNLSFFKEDIWYKVSDSYFTTGEEWDRQRTASIKDYWPNFGHKIPTSPSDGKYINYFPGWVGAAPNEEGLIPSEGSKFTDTPIRKIGNIVSLASVVGVLLLAVIKNKWKEKT